MVNPDKLVFVRISGIIRSSEGHKPNGTTGKHHTTDADMIRKLHTDVGRLEFCGHCLPQCLQKRSRLTLAKAGRISSILTDCTLKTEHLKQNTYVRVTAQVCIESAGSGIDARSKTS